MASCVTVHIVNIRVNTVNLGFASGNIIFLTLTICTVTLEAMKYLYIIIPQFHCPYKTPIDKQLLFLLSRQMYHVKLYHGHVVHLS